MSARIVNISSQQLKKLHSYKMKSYLDTVAFWKLIIAHGQEVPEELTLEIVESWLAGEVNKARLDHLSYILRHWQFYSENPPCPVPLPKQKQKVEHQYIAFTQQHWRILNKLRQRSRIGAVKLFKLASLKQEPPKGLNGPIISGWLARNCKAIRKDHFDYVLHWWRKAPICEYTQLGQSHRKALEVYRLKSTMGVHKLLTEAEKREALVEGLTHNKITGWLSGKIKTARKDHWQYVIKHWSFFSGKNSIEAMKMVSLTEQIIEELREYKSLVGMTTLELLNASVQLEDLPKGLSVHKVNADLNSRNMSIHQYQLTYLLWWWKVFSSSTETASMALALNGRISIAKADMHQLEKYRAISKVPYATLFSKVKCLPKGLHQGAINQWKDGQQKNARIDHYFYILSHYRSLAEKGCFADEYVHLSKLSKQRVETYLPAIKKHLNLISDVPEDFLQVNFFEQLLIEGMIKSYLWDYLWHFLTAFEYFEKVSTAEKSDR